MIGKYALANYWWQKKTPLVNIDMLQWDWKLSALVIILSNLFCLCPYVVLFLLLQWATAWIYYICFENKIWPLMKKKIQVFLNGNLVWVFRSLVHKLYVVVTESQIYQWQRSTSVLKVAAQFNTIKYVLSADSNLDPQY